MRSKKTPASVIALGGVLAALAVVIMCLGTLIPLATYICPILCAMVLKVVHLMCGSRIAWAWYGAVSILSLLMAPDKEAAAVFLTMGYYPIVKPKLDTMKGQWLWKGLLFNGSILAMYWLLMHLFGLEQVVQDFEGMGIFFVALLLVMGNMTFFLLDRLLGMKFGKRK